MSFLHWGLLQYGLPLISIPLIIHLLNRRRFRRVRWSAMEFLLKAQKKNRRRVRVENLLLLLLRTLLVLLIVLLVSRPLSTGGALAFLPGSSEAVERILIIDDSASLGQKLGQKSAFEPMRDAVIEFCKELGDKRGSDLLTIIRGSRPDAPVLVRQSPGSAEVERVLTSMEKWRPVDLSIDLAAAVRALVDNSSEEAGRGAGNKRQRVLYVMTDLRLTDWIGPDQGKSAGIREQLAAFQTDESANILLIDAAGEDVANLGVTELKCLDPVAVVGLTVRFQAKVKNFGGGGASDVQLLLQVGESIIPVEPIESLEPGEEKAVEIRHTFRSPGVQSLTLKLVNAGARDGLEKDNLRYLSIEVREQIRALLVDGEPSADSFEGEVAFLQRALAPPGEVLSGVAVKVIRREELVDEELSDYEIVILANLDSWPAERKISALEAFVRQGGGLAVYLGSQVEAGRYNRDFYKDGAGLLPYALGEVEGSGKEEEAFFLQPDNLNHPLTRLFKGQDVNLLRNIRFWKRFSLARPSAGSEDRPPSVVMSFEDGGKRIPAIIERTYGRGRVLLFNATADRGWNNWPRDYSYVIVSQEMVRFLAPLAAAERNLSAGEAISRAVSTARFATSARLRGPRYPDVPERQLFAQAASPDSPISVFKDDATRLAGLYTLTLEPRPGADLPAKLPETFAVNLAAEEGDLRRIDMDRLRGSLPGLRLELAKLSDASTLYRLTEGERKELWRTIIYAFLILLLIEGALALRAGHHRREDPDDEDAAEAA